MPPLNAVFSGDATPLQRELQRIPKMTQQAMRDMRGALETHFKMGNLTGNPANSIFNPVPPKSAVREYGEWWSKALDEKSKADRKSMGERRSVFSSMLAAERAAVAQSFNTSNTSSGGLARARGRFAVSGSMFMSVARDSAVSLASGARIAQVIAQQAPQVFQALSMMGLGMLAIKASAVGLASVLAYQVVKSLKDSYLLTREISDGMIKIADAAHRYKNSLELRDLQKLLSISAEAEALGRKIREERQTAEQEDAAAALKKEQIRGAFTGLGRPLTPKEEIEQQQKLLKVDLERAEAKIKLAEAATAVAKEVKDAEAAMEKFQQDWTKQIAEDEAAVKKASSMSALPGMFGTGLDPEKLKARNDAVLAAQAKLEQNRVQAAAEQKRLQSELELARKNNGQAEVEKAKAEKLRLENELQNAGQKKLNEKLSTPNVNDRQRHGAFVGTPQTMVDLTRVSVSELRTIRTILQGQNRNPAARPIGAVNYGR